MDGIDRRSAPGARFLAGLAASYLAAIVAATWPAAATVSTRLAVADLSDPVQHLWQMRWHRACLLAGRSPMACPDVQRPVGSPLGLYSPLQLQTALFLALSAASSNDVLIYNAILAAELLTTGLGTFALAWSLSRSRPGSALAGLLAMLGGPMTANTLAGGTELMALGSFPVFLVGWLRLVDRPSAPRLAAAVGLYLLLSASAPYYGVLAVVPAAVHVAVEAARGGRRGVAPWLRSRGPWLVGFGVAAALTTPLLFPEQVWAVARGASMARSRAQFDHFGATIWHYLVPGPSNTLARWVAPPFWMAPGFADRPTVYLGVVSSALVAVAAARRSDVAHRRTLWAASAALVALSIGSTASIGPWTVPMPAGLLWDWCPPFRSLRVPARFGYLASVLLAVLAGGAAADLLRGVAGRRRRALIAAGVVGLAVADLAAAPFPTRAVPAMPAGYAAILRGRPGASLCEVHPSDAYMAYQATIAYWQPRHGGRTSAGNPGVENRRLSHGSYLASPFHYERLARPDYLADAGPGAVDVVEGARFEDYARLYLESNGFDLLVLHKWTFDGSPTPAPILRIRDRLAPAICHEDAELVAIDARRLPPPTAPTALRSDGWRGRAPRRGEAVAVASAEAAILAENPDPSAPLTLRLRVAAHRRPRVVRLLDGGRELARWRVGPGAPEVVESPPFLLPGGVRRLTLASDGSERPSPSALDVLGGDAAPFSLWVSSIHLAPADPGPVADRRPAPPARR